MGSQEYASTAARCCKHVSCKQSKKTLRFCDDVLPAFKSFKPKQELRLIPALQTHPGAVSANPLGRAADEKGMRVTLPKHQNHRAFDTCVYVYIYNIRVCVIYSHEGLRMSLHLV